MMTLLPHAKLSMQVQLFLRSHLRRKYRARHSKEQDKEPHDGGEEKKQPVSECLDLELKFDWKETERTILIIL